MKKTALITGASSGIGCAAAKFFADKDWNVIATMRNPAAEKELAQTDNVLVMRLDVRDGDSIGRTVEAGLARFGKIDALINNAGFGLSGVFETLPRAKIQEQFDVNVLGVMDVTRAVLPHFRKNQSGLIINVSSRAGLVGLPLNSLYCASKFALEGFSEALAYELASQNIVIKIIEPSGGVSETCFSERMSGESAQNRSLPDYDRFVADTNAGYAGMRAKRMVSAAEVAQLIFAAATDGTRLLRYFIGEDAGDFVKARRELAEPDYLEFMRSRFMRD